MRLRTVLSVLLVCGALLGVVYVGLDDAGDTLSVTWTSDTAVDAGGNHHEPAVAVVDGKPMVYAPISSSRVADQCEVVALSGDTGEREWNYRVPQASCTLHSVADPTVVDYDTDGTREVLAASTEREVIAFGPMDGAVERRFPLTDYGYTTPIVADVAVDAPGENDTATDEMLVADVNGFVQAIRPNGSVAWSVNRSTYVWATPAVGDLDSDGETEAAVAGRDGLLAAYDRTGDTEWERDTGESMTWLTSGQLDDDPAIELVGGSQSGSVVAWDGATGAQEWRYETALLSAVHAIGAVDGDPTVFATAADGSLVALDGNTGEVRWKTTVTTEKVQMMPPPVLGDVDGDREDELVVAANDGTVAVYNPETGEVLASHERDVDILAHPVLHDVDDDSAKELFVIYADGRIQRFDYEGSEN
ncbi:PQQ-binding-like beta-propeller repeat protein [Haloarchaeobius sp. DFWS5]|uniref:outer membrane protein assembly factor BamB family protein n=1 Tax=Haloarchaeobius sp. DFWS5 TaxID=3446114 RepID=UPI003EBF2657